MADMAGSRGRRCRGPKKSGELKKKKKCPQRKKI
jgi:hypothetical protein